VGMVHPSTHMSFPQCQPYIMYVIHVTRYEKTDYLLQLFKTH